MRLRITWGGGANRTWFGKFTAAGGEISRLTPLGLAPDAGATLMLQGNSVLVRSIQSTDFAGVDFDWTGNSDATLLIEMESREAPGNRLRHSLTMSEILSADDSSTRTQLQLDENQNRIEITRAPGDRLRPIFSRPHLVFSSGERFEFLLAPIDKPQPGLNNAQLQIELKPARSDDVIWRQQLRLRANDRQLVLDESVAIDLPQEEGAYDVQLSLVDNNLASRWKWNRQLYQRTIQLVVISSARPPAESVELWREIATIDPAQRDWLERIPTLPHLRLANWSPGVLGNRGVSVLRLGQQQLVSLQPGGWQAIPLHVDQPNRPHIVEIEYLDDGPLSLGISLLQPDMQGQIPPFGMDSGISIPDENAPGETTIRKHRMFVWPSHSTPYLLVANRHDRRSAAIGKIRLMAGPERLAPQSTSLPSSEHRQYFAFYEKPLFADNFSAIRHVDRETGQSIDDWHSFYTGASRWAEYLKANGYTGAMLVVAADGSALYPSEALQPSPRFDSGSFSSQGHDPIRKDVVEMLARVFQREGLRLIPVIHFNSPLVALEQLREFDNTAAGIDLVDPQGHALRSVFRDGTRPVSFYNLLDPKVRQATLAVAQEFVERYQNHSCMGGLGVLYARDAVCVMPGQTWGVDRFTIQRFAQQSGLQTELESSGYEFIFRLLQSERRDLWLNWRTHQTGRWLTQLQLLGAKFQGDGKLFVLGTDMFRTQDAFSALTPSLRRRSNLVEAANRIALPIETINQHPQIVLLHPFELAVENTLAENRLNVHLQQSNQLGELTGETPAGVLFTHRCAWAQFSELQKHKLFGQSQQQPLMRLQPLIPSDRWNRERFVHNLRQADCHYFVDGGWLTSFGQEEQIAELIEIFTRLPAAPFLPVESSQAQPQGPVVRQAKFDGFHYFYVVNPTPWPVEATLQIRGDVSSLESLSQQIISGDGGDNQQFTVQLAPFQLAGFRGPTNLQVEDFQTVYPTKLEEQLQSRLNQLVTKVSRAENALPIQVLTNPGFEQQSTTGGDPANIKASNEFGWFFEHQDQISLQQDDVKQGDSALVIHSQGKEIWIRSNEFAPPVTGRLSVAAWMRTSDPANPPPIRISIDGHDGIQRYYRYGQINSTGPDASDGADRIGQQWRQFAVHFDDIPPAGMDGLRIGFDLMGPGQVEIDQVEIYDRWLDAQDSNALTQLLALAGFQLTNHQNYDQCRHILEGYWPRFLREFFPDPVAPPEPESDPTAQLPVNDSIAEPPRASFFDQFKNDIFPNRR